MKKFLTVLLALSVVFTYSFSAVGTAFADTSSNAADAEKALNKVAQDVKDSIAYYDGTGYMKTTDAADAADNYISKTAVEQRVGEIVDKYAKAINNANGNWDAAWEAVNTVDKFKDELFDSAPTEEYTLGAALNKSNDWKDSDTYYVFGTKNGCTSDVDNHSEPAKYATQAEFKAAWTAYGESINAGDTSGSATYCAHPVEWIYANTYASLFQKQYVIDRDAARTAVNSADLSAYSAETKKEIQAVIDKQHEKIEDTVDDYTAGNITAVVAIDAFRAAVAEIKDALGRDTAAQEAQKLTEAKNAASKALSDAAEAFIEAAEDHYKGQNTAEAISKLDTLNSDVDKMAAFFEDKIDAAETVDDVDDIKAVIADTFKVNTPYSDSEFYGDLNTLKDADVLKAYAESYAVDMKNRINGDGSKMYQTADVDAGLDNALEKIAEAAYDVIADTPNAVLNTDVVIDAFREFLDKKAYFSLTRYRKDAIAAISTDDYFADNWSDERKDKVEAIQDAAFESILLAATTGEIDEIVEQAKADMDAILNDAQIAALTSKTRSILNTLGYTGTQGVLDKYYDAAVGMKEYSPAIKADAIDNAVEVFVDAVIATENADISYAEIEKIIAENRDKALETLKDVRTLAELNTQAAALKTQFAALPKTVTLADKDTILAARDAYDAYLEEPGARTGDVTNSYLLDNALSQLIALEEKAVRDQIRALPAASDITVNDEAAIVAARAALDALEETYDVDATISNENVLQRAEAALENAKIKDAADKINALSANLTREAVEAARAAYDKLSLVSRLSFNDELYADLVRAEQALVLVDIKAVEALKITAGSSAVKGAITVRWTVKGDASVADGYQIYRSVKKNSGFGAKPIFTTTKQTYKNTKSLKKGTRYYYKVRAYKVVDGKTYYSDWSNKAYRIAK